MRCARLLRVTCTCITIITAVLPLAYVHAETVTCTPITALPAVITVQGIYCFTGDLSAASTGGTIPAIDIQTNNVVLDLNGFKLGGLGVGPGTNETGIRVSNRQNVTIKNGTVRGFLYGIVLDDGGASQGHLVEDIRADQNTYFGLYVVGTGNIVRNNQVVATGGSTAFGPNASAFGIYVSGSGSRVLNNDVINTLKQGAGIARGIFIQTMSGGMAVNNRITGADRGIEFDASTGKYRDNLTFGVATPFTLGTDAGNNN